MIPADSIAANSFLADSSFSASSWQALANTGGPGKVETVWRTGCFGSKAKKPLEEIKSGYSERRSRNSSVERIVVYRSELLLDELDEMAYLRVEES